MANLRNVVHPLFPHHNKDAIENKLRCLKQTDGEAWAIADFVEKQMKYYDDNSTVVLTELHVPKSPKR